MKNEKMIEMLAARKMCLTSQTYVDKQCNEDCDNCKYNYLMGNMGEQIELCNELIIILATFCSIEKNLINNGSNPFDKYVNKQMKEGEPLNEYQTTVINNFLTDIWNNKEGE